MSKQSNSNNMFDRYREEFGAYFSCWQNKVFDFVYNLQHRDKLSLFITGYKHYGALQLIIVTENFAFTIDFSSNITCIVRRQAVASCNRQFTISFEEFSSILKNVS